MGSKLLMLVTAVLAAAALAAPAAQAEEFWYQEPGEVLVGGESEAVEFEAVGEISTSVSGFATGPCEISTSGYLWNGPEGAEAEIVEGTGGECATNIPGCFAEKLTYHNQPWTFKALGKGKVAIEGMTVTHHYSPICLLWIFSKTTSAAGTATVDKAFKPDCFVYFAEGHIKTEPGNAPVVFAGEFCFKNGFLIK